MISIKKLALLGLCSVSCVATEISNTNSWDSIPIAYEFSHSNEIHPFDSLSNMMYIQCASISTYLHENQNTISTEEKSYLQGKLDAYIDIYLWIDGYRDRQEYPVNPCLERVIH